MSRLSAASWWNQTLDELGVQGMDRTLSPRAEWDEILQSGREELAAAICVVPLRFGQSLRVLDVGCGIGRVSFALADHFGEVVGIDISPSLIETAKARNQSPRVSFRHMTETRLEPDQEAVYDIVFANEVFYYLTWPMLQNYCQDAHRLLRPGGEFAFQLNLEPISMKTRVSWLVRKILWACGVKSWRGWSNGPGFRRYYHPVEKVRGMLEETGFRVERFGTGRSIRQTWILAIKPESA